MSDQENETNILLHLKHEIMWLEPAGPVINHANRVAMGTTFGIPRSNLENQSNNK